MLSISKDGPLTLLTSHFLCSCSGDCGIFFFFYQICRILDAQPSNGYINKRENGLVSWEDGSGVIFP